MLESLLEPAETIEKFGEKRLKEEKQEVLRRSRKSWRGAHLGWLETALVLDDEGRPRYPGLLGTGGNDGRLDFTNNAMQWWAHLVDTQATTGAATKDARNSLLASLFEKQSVFHHSSKKIGQFYPAAAGGANGTTEPSSPAHMNPWDLVLALEGAIAVQSRATRRLEVGEGSRLSSPFMLHSQPTGYQSAGSEEEHGEQWLPLWRRPTTFGELRSVFGEGRLRSGSSCAATPVSAARALGCLGTTRGLASFVRFGFLKRNGKSHLAVPLGRLQVRPHPQVRLSDDLAGWMDRLERASHDVGAPARLRHAVKALADAVFAALSHDPSPSRWQAVLLSASRVELLQIQGTGYEAGPIPRLRSAWLEAANDGSVEWRLAVSLAMACAFPYRGRDARNGVRRHAIPLADYGRFATSGSGHGLLHEPDVVLTGRRLVDELVDLLLRRAADTRASGTTELNLRAPWGFDASPIDLARFVGGEVDDDRILGLARALMAVEVEPKPAKTQASVAHERGDREPELEQAWWAIRLACSAEELAPGIRAALDPAILRRGASGDGAGAVDLALRRLAGRGIHPAFSGAIAGSDLSRRWVAALAFPISKYTTQLWARRLDPAFGDNR